MADGGGVVRVDRDKAECRSTSPELFFPAGYTKAFRGRIAKAKAVCRLCSQKAACLEAALDSEGGIDERGRAGIWGETTPGERVRIHRKRLAAAREPARQ